jgi:invasion protein IalB
MRCQRLAAANSTQRVCEVAQSVQTQGQQNPILQIALGSLGAKEPIKLTIVAPVNVSFPSSVRFAVDEKDQQPTELAWRRCLAGGCFAELEVKDDQLKRWRAQGGAGLVKFVDACRHCRSAACRR